MAARWVKVKKVGTWIGRVLLALLIFLAFALGFGTPQADAEKMRVFAEAVERWQHNPDFRKVQVEYVELGTDAMRTRACWVETTKGVMWLRSMPGLPEHLRVNDTSLAHYTNFTRGTLSAYMHLTGEQGLADTLKMLQELAAGNPNPTDQQIVAFLKQYKLHHPVVSDAGAVESVRSLLRDVDPARGFPPDTNVADKLKVHIVSLAVQSGYPTELSQMTPRQQRNIWAGLDDYIKEHDYELWRTKQVNDWLNGVWAQVYGTMYSGLIHPTLVLRDVGRVLAPVLLMGWIALTWYARKRPTEAALPASALQPQLALEGGKLPGSDPDPSRVELT